MVLTWKKTASPWPQAAQRTDLVRGRVGSEATSSKSTRINSQFRYPQLLWNTPWAPLIRPIRVRRPRLGALLQASSSSGTYLLCWAAKGCRPWRERDHACSDAAARTRAPGEHWMRAAPRRVVIGGATGKTSLRHRTCMLGRDDGASSCHPWRAAPPELAPRTPLCCS